MVHLNDTIRDFQKNNLSVNPIGCVDDFGLVKTQRCARTDLS